MWKRVWWYDYRFRVFWGLTWFLDTVMCNARRVRETTIFDRHHIEKSEGDLLRRLEQNPSVLVTPVMVRAIHLKSCPTQIRFLLFDFWYSLITSIATVPAPLIRLSRAAGDRITAFWELLLYGYGFFPHSSKCLYNTKVFSPSREFTPSLLEIIFLKSIYKCKVVTKVTDAYFIATNSNIGLW